MNFNLYLDRDSFERLDRLARHTGTARNALVRKAVSAWLDREQSAWPKEVVDFTGDPSVVPFESHRSELQPSEDDPFGPRTRAARRRSRSTRAAR